MFALLRKFRHMRRALPPIKNAALAVVGIGLLVSACSVGPLPRLISGADPADPKARTRPSAYQPVTGGYVAARPASPVLPGSNADTGAKAKP